MARISIYILMALALVYAGLRWGIAPTQKSHAYFEGRGFEVIAHGAGQGLQPKNTLEAALMANRVGADIIEIDIHATRDGVLVLSHDDTVDDMTNGSGLIREMDFAQLQALDAAHGFLREKNSPLAGQGIRIPALSAVFDALPDAHYIIEIKQPEPPIHTALCQLVRERGLQNQVLVGSFFTEPLEAFRSACPEVATSMSQGEVTRLVLLEKIGLSHLYDLPGVALQLPMTSGSITIVTDSFLSAMQARGVKVHIWTINSLDDMRELMAMGVDGIITDYPDRLIRLRDNLTE
ncbi:glycerophosphodiester phosphodiesterase [Simiduia agarivorans]|uniref:Glycerophosphoryl diester phosphodiesterase n=1 Tax=Simiduia agarivorans (strain DSM 21679 / JCM 13881 / BCRC 17597 / SA1) TaxID=1117647 RepID=K4KIQ4_SIMAS|nr:glycerophosphodiester phosphodiesterase [Simiduia agarivorans]AFU98075.1 glycerophosphoryl diester phosphodiesterase [Simiduia agarivorans SA1 = DSM 21679]